MVFILIILIMVHDDTSPVLHRRSYARRDAHPAMPGLWGHR